MKGIATISQDDRAEKDFFVNTLMNLMKKNSLSSVSIR